MTLTETIWNLVDTATPPLSVALVAVTAILCSLSLARRRGERGALIFIAGVVNFVLIYIWIYAAEPTFQQRAVGIRLSIVQVLIAISFYSARRAGLWQSLRRALRRLWGEG